MHTIIMIVLSLYNTSRKYRRYQRWMCIMFVDGKTNTQDALRLTYQSVFTSTRGDRSGVRNVAIVVSDGNSNVDADRTLTEAEAARQRGIELFAVAVGQRPNAAEMASIASDPDSEHLLYMRSENELTSTANSLLGLLCNL